MNLRTTYLSFWNVELSNLPEGTFRRRPLSRDDARSVIDSARNARKLLCVAKDDLGAPYGERARERHEQLCAALRDHVGIEIQLRDFFGRDCATPLCVAEVNEQCNLLVVDCTYTMDMDAPGGAVPDDNPVSAESFDAKSRTLAKGMLQMRIAPDSIKFSVFERINVGPDGTGEAG